MKIRLFLVLCAGILFFIAGSVALISASAENKGGSEIKLPGGTRGPVPFPHHRHQNVLADCQICHSLYPQKPGIIEVFKDRGKLKKKQVMNKQCTQCHRQKKQEGMKTGPITCATCHVKD